MFLNLTTFPVDSIVPLRNLVDEAIFKELYGRNTPSISIRVRGVGAIIETLMLMGVPLPATYYPSLMALGRPDKLTDSLQMLDAQFLAWEQNSEKKLLKKG